MPVDHNHRRVVIACCQDFAPKCQALRQHFQTLFDTWQPNHYNVETINFSFKDGIGQMIALLNAATIFYMGGVHGLHRTNRINAATEHVQQIITVLKNKVQRNEIAYIGVCGGGMLAGKSTAFAQTPFDLLCGTNV